MLNRPNFSNSSKSQEHLFVTENFNAALFLLVPRPPFVEKMETKLVLPFIMPGNVRKGESLKDIRLDPSCTPCLYVQTENPMQRRARVKYPPPSAIG